MLLLKEAAKFQQASNQINYRDTRVHNKSQKTAEENVIINRAVPEVPESILSSH